MRDFERGLTHEQLLEILHYDPVFLEWRWLIDLGHGRPKAGSIAGNLDKSKGRVRIQIDGKTYRASRLAFFYMTKAWPKDEIDHKNRDKQSDQWDNLRPATRDQNSQNIRRQRNNISRHTRVFLCKGKLLCRPGRGHLNKPWMAKVCFNGKHITRYFVTREEAIAARIELAKQHHGEFANISLQPPPEGKGQYNVRNENTSPQKSPNQAANYSDYSKQSPSN